METATPKPMPNRLKRIEIVTHCWAGKFEHYARCFQYQVSSLVLNPPQNCNVSLCLCYDPNDVVQKTLGKVRNWLDESKPGLAVLKLPIRQLGRRAIGRNIVAKQTPADLVWFTDCDHVFRDGVLDRLAEFEWPEGASMIYPKQIMIHRDHTTGDQAIARMNGSEPLDVDPSEFVPKRYNRAIGGVQIVRGEFAREYGYLDGSRWQSPLHRDTFVSCRCDRAYRKFCKQHGPIVPIDLPGVYRIRHTQTTHHEP